MVEEKTGHVFLSAFRGFALVVAAFQIFFVGDFRFYDSFDWTVLGVVAAYTLDKVSRPLRWYNRVGLNYADFGFDLDLVTALPLTTGGLNSPFLLYCMCPVLTSALFFPHRLTFSIVGIPITSIIASQIIVYLVSPASFFYPLGLSLGLLGAIVVGSFIIGGCPI